MKRNFVFLFLFCFMILSAQEGFYFKKNIVNANYYYATAKNFTENGMQISYYRRTEVEENLHFEYGANIYFSDNKNPLVYKKNDSVYYTNTSGFNFDFGIKMVKTKKFSKNHVEWSSELGFGAITFDRGDIPKTENRNYNQDNTIQIDTGLEALSTFNIGQELRFFRGDIGGGIKINYLPVYLTEKKHLQDKLDMFRFSLGIVYKF